MWVNLTHFIGYLKLDRFISLRVGLDGLIEGVPYTRGILLVVNTRQSIKHKVKINKAALM